MIKGIGLKQFNRFIFTKAPHFAALVTTLNQPTPTLTFRRHLHSDTTVGALTRQLSTLSLKNPKQLGTKHELNLKPATSSTIRTSNLYEAIISLAHQFEIDDVVSGTTFQTTPLLAALIQYVIETADKTRLRNLSNHESACPHNQKDTNCWKLTNVKITARDNSVILDVKGSKANKLAFCKLIHEEISRAGKALRVLTKEISDSKMENLSYTPEPNAFYINQPIPEAMTGLFKAFIAIYTSPSISVKHVKMSDLNGHYICGPNENDLANFKDKLDSIIDSIFTNSGANTNRMKR